MFITQTNKLVEHSVLQTLASDLVSLLTDTFYLLSSVTFKYLDMTHVHVLSGREKNSPDKVKPHTHTCQVSSPSLSLSLCSSLHAITSVWSYD